MSKAYLLLRDNKQSGPYSLEELLQQSLKPFDLIWMEGRSTGWQYPGEIDTLKPFAPPAPAPQRPSHQQTHNSSPDQASSRLPSLPVGSSRKVPDSASHIYVSFPSPYPPFPGQVPSSPAPAPQAEGPTEADLDKRAEAIRARVQAIAEGKKVAEEDGELKVQYARSLEDMKADYANWMYRLHHKKSGWKKFRKPVLIGLATVLFCLSGFFAGKKLINAKSEQAAGAAKAVPAPEELAVNPKPVENNRTKTTAELIQNTSVSLYPAPLFQGEEAAGKPKVSALPKTKTQPDPNIQPVISRQSADSLLQSAPELVLSKSLPVETASVKSENPAEAPKTAPEAPATENNSDLPHFIKVSEYYPAGSEGLDGAMVRVENQSTATMNMIAIDLLYLNEENKLLVKKTVYFNNVLPKSTVEKPVPRQRKAAFVKSQIGLISSNNGLYYLR